MTGLMGTAFSVLIRLELSAPGSQFLAGDNQLYNVIATSHGIIMIYFMVVPSMAGFGNYIAPMLVGAPDNNKANILQHRVLGPWLAGLGMVTFGFLIRSMLPHTTTLSTSLILPLHRHYEFIYAVTFASSKAFENPTSPGLTLIIGVIAPALHMSFLHW